MAVQRPNKEMFIANRYHNPGCIRRFAPLYYWDAQTGEKRSIPFTRGSGDHTCFENDMDGLIAMRIVIEEQFNRTGRRTLNEIMYTYAPPGENNTEKYIAHLSRQLGVGRKEELDLDDPEIVKKLMKGIARYEGALVGTRYTDEMFDKAVHGVCMSENASLKMRHVRRGNLVQRRVSDTARAAFETAKKRIDAPTSVPSEQQNFIKETGTRTMTDSVFEHAEARLSGKLYGGIRCRRRYSETDLEKMKQTVSDLHRKGLLPAGDIDRQATVLLYKLQQVNRLTDGRTRIAVNGRREHVWSYLSKDGGMLPQTAEKLLKTESLNTEEQKALAQTLQRIDSVVGEQGGILKTVTKQGRDKSQLCQRLNEGQQPLVIASVPVRGVRCV